MDLNSKYCNLDKHLRTAKLSPTALKADLDMYVDIQRLKSPAARKAAQQHRVF